jgi:predicted MPP superfamily phosphohydrolase
MPGDAMGPTSELVVTAVFVLLVVTVLVAYAFEITARVLKRVQGTPRAPAGRWRTWWRRGVLVLGTVGSACMVWGWTVEPGWIEVTREEVALPRLAPGTRPIRVVHVSDLHVGASPGNEERLPDLVAAEHPDLIAFTGDSLVHAEGRPRLLACLERLAAIAPLYAVKGNWDVFQFGHLPVLEESRARLLDNEIVEVEVRGRRLALAGMRYGRDAEVPRLLAKAPPGIPCLFLHHTPDPVLEAAQAGVDLMLAGHTHGGQVRLPAYGALLTLSKHGKRFESGLYRVDRTWLYVNRGLGMEGQPAPQVRFLCRPEVTVLDLVPEAPGTGAR